MAQYPHNIPSLHQTFPDVPNVLGDIDLNLPVQEGQPMNPEVRQNAKSVAKAVKDAHDMGIAVFNPEVVEAAELREFAVTGAHSMAMYMPGNLVQALGAINDQLVQINNQLGHFNHQFSVVTANTENLRITARNSHTIPVNYQPLLKTRAGHGLNLALAVFPGQNGQAVQQLLVPPDPVPVVGAVPPWFQTNFHGYTRADVVRLIIFYNDDFGIVLGDTVATCVERIQAFLAVY